MIQIDRHNNFDLIRLIAASQVLIWHAAVHLGVFDSQYIVLKILYNIPGVPIFFALSGFLISVSIDKINFSFKKYAWSRSLRLFPALFVCLMLTFTLLLWSGASVSVIEWIGFFFSHMTFLQFWVPDGLKVWGVGHPNGSLWSISVEIQLYILLPLLVLSLKKSKLIVKNLVLLGLFLLSIVYRIIIETYPIGVDARILQLGTMFLIYHLHFFIIGIAFYFNFKVILSWIKDKVLIWFCLYVIYVMVFKYYLGFYENPYSYSIYGVTANILLALLTFSFAFSNKTWSSRLLGRNDFSYGLYIYHMPVVNLLVHKGLTGQVTYFMLACLISSVLAVVSWLFIERVALQFKQ